MTPGSGSPLRPVSLPKREKATLCPVTSTVSSAPSLTLMRADLGENSNSFNIGLMKYSPGDRERKVRRPSVPVCWLVLNTSGKLLGTHVLSY